MIDDHELKLALRSRLLSAQIVTTGSVTLTPTGTGFTRVTGDFLADGFVPGMEVTPSGFTDNSIGVIKTVTATAMDFYSSRSAEASQTGTLTVGIPAIREWENVAAERQPNRWLLREQYIPGVPTKNGLGSQGNVEQYPAYVLTIESLAGIGTAAISAMIHHFKTSTFPPMLAISLAGGDTVRVQGDPAPFASQVLNREAGIAEVVFTIPLIADTRNPI